MLTNEPPKKAIIYKRVSSLSQVNDGSGLSSQETACKEYAKQHNYDVIATFEDAISGTLYSRPGMLKMLAFLYERSSPTVVIIDDINRLARDVSVHRKLREVIADAGGILKSPKAVFKNSADHIFAETINAALSEHGARKNAEIGRSRSEARVKSGYFITRAPVGYHYKKIEGHGKMLVRDEPLASIIQEGLESYATGRFQTQTEVRRFFESKAVFPRNKHGEVGAKHVNDILTRHVYAGYIQLPKWGISLRKGKHEGLISLETFETIQERLNGKPMVPINKHTTNDFPLRGFVACSDCDQPMTAAWSKGKYQHFPYYRCNQRDCISKGKSINANKMHAEFSDLLKTLTPAADLIKVATLIFKDVWEQKMNLFDEDMEQVKKELIGTNDNIYTLLDRILKTESDTLITAYENRIQELERKKLVLTEKLAQKQRPPKEKLNTFKEAIKFLSNPQKLWESDKAEDKKAVLKLAFSERLPYTRNIGFGTPNLSLPFKALGSNCAANFKMVPLGRIELPASPLPMVRSTTELQRPEGIEHHATCTLDAPIATR